MALSGLRARGGFEVVIQWKDGKLESATIRNAVPAIFKVRNGGRTAEASIKAGQAVHLNGELMTVDNPRQ
jgi:alpha-L-fucosidase 2